MRQSGAQCRCANGGALGQIPGQIAVGDAEEFAVEASGTELGERQIEGRARGEERRHEPMVDAGGAAPQGHAPISG